LLQRRRFGFAFTVIHLFKPPGNRHFDRSCSQPHREQRSGEIRFSTSTFPAHRGALASVFPFVLFAQQKESCRAHEESGHWLCFCLAIIFFAFSAQKSHVKPQNDLNASNKRK